MSNHKNHAARKMMQEMSLMGQFPLFLLMANVSIAGVMCRETGSKCKSQIHFLFLRFYIKKCVSLNKIQSVQFSNYIQRNKVHDKQNELIITYNHNSRIHKTLSRKLSDIRQQRLNPRQLYLDKLAEPPSPTIRGKKNDCKFPRFVIYKIKSSSSEISNHTIVYII